MTDAHIDRSWLDDRYISIHIYTLIDGVKVWRLPPISILLSLTVNK